MSLERLTPNMPPLENLLRTSPEDLEWASVRGRDLIHNYVYDFGFIVNQPRGSFITIDTQERWAFLRGGRTERQVEEALVYVSRETRELSGGVFDINPSFGAVMGTKLNPLVPDLSADQELRSQILRMTINLTGADSPTANPNQENRDMARDKGIADLVERWDDENARYNTTAGIPRAMNLTPENIVNLMRRVGRNAGLTGLTLSGKLPQG